jgi:transcriptional regulator with XRE-family HTH domain
MPLDLKNVGARIAEVRRESGQQQQEFAAAIGTSLRSLAGYERGEREPRAELLAGIYTATGVNPTWILFGDKVAAKRASTPVRLAKATLRDLADRLAAMKKTLPPDVLSNVYEVLLEHAIEQDSVDPEFTRKVLSLQ